MRLPVEVRESLLVELVEALVSGMHWTVAAGVPAEDVRRAVEEAAVNWKPRNRRGKRGRA